MCISQFLNEIDTMVKRIWTMFMELEISVHKKATYLIYPKV